MSAWILTRVGQEPRWYPRARPRERWGRHNLNQLPSKVLMTKRVRMIKQIYYHSQCLAPQQFWCLQPIVVHWINRRSSWSTHFEPKWATKWASKEWIIKKVSPSKYTRHYGPTLSKNRKNEKKAATGLDWVLSCNGKFSSSIATRDSRREKKLPFSW